jgi:hypothetical protein
MKRSALACLPAALLATFLGAIATPCVARANATAFDVQGEQVSLRRVDASQFMADTHPRSTTTRDSIRLGPGSDEPTTLVDGSDPETDRALSAAVHTALTVLYVASAIALCAALISVYGSLHSATPLAQGTSR